MHRTLDILTGILGLIVAAALVVAGVVYMVKRSVEPSKILFKLLFTVPFVGGCLWLAPHILLGGPFLIVAMAVVLSFMWTPHIGEWVASPITSLFDGGHEPPETKP